MNEQKGYITNPTLFGQPEIIGFGSESFHIKEMNKEISNDMIIKNHYSHKVAGFATTYIYLGVYIENELLGTLQYGFAMNPASAKSIVKDTGIYEYLELNRMWIDDKAGRNTESKAISYSIRYIKARFPKIKWIQSFADERCGCFGVVYQAANFKYYGEHDSDFYSLDGEFIHKIAITHISDKRPEYQRIRARKSELTKESLRQFRYIYFIKPKYESLCLLKQKPFPKNYENDNKEEMKSYKRFGNIQ